MAPTPPPSLTYETKSPPAPRPKRLTLDESPLSFTLTFPLSPGWLHYLIAASFIGMSIFGLTMVASCVLLMRRWNIPIDPGVARGMTLKLVPWCWTSWAIFDLIRHRRFGRVPTTLSVENHTLYLSRQSFWWGIHRRHWPLRDVRQVKFKDLKSIVPRHVASELLITIDEKHFPLHYRVAGYKVPILRHFAELLTQAVTENSPTRPDASP